MDSFWFSTYTVMPSRRNDCFVSSFLVLLTTVSFSHFTSLDSTRLNGSKENILKVSSLIKMFAEGVYRHLYEIKAVPFQS